jgi:predicted ATP-grasp superfamily ATP-dependent carboligase
MCQMKTTRTRGSFIEVGDLLVLHGAEPDFRWKKLADDVMEFALTHGVVEWVSIGAVPAAVPHTRPVPVFATASDPGLLRHGETLGPEGLLRVPAAALSVVEMSVSGAGIPTAGFYAQVPPYVRGPYAAGTITLVEHVARHLEVEIPLGSLMDEANAQRIGLDTAVQSQEETRDFVTRLEEQQPDDGIPSGDELASEIERYLRDAGDDPR